MTTTTNRLGPRGTSATAHPPVRHRDGWRSWLGVVGIYAATRLIDAWFIVLAAGSRSVTPLPPGYHVAVPPRSPVGYRDLATGWDAQWYWDIVLHGYPDQVLDAAGEPVQTSIAFFPLYPMVCRAVGWATGVPFDVVGPTMSLLLGLAAFLVVYRLFAEVVGSARALAGLAVLGCFVTAPVFQIAYTESLALLLVAATLLMLRQRRYVAALAPVLLLGLTRNITLVLLPVLAVHWWVRMRAVRRTAETVSRREYAAGAALAAAIVFAVFEWPLLAGVTTGDPGAYFTTMKAWPGYSTSVLSPPWLELVASAGVGGIVVATFATVIFGLLLAAPGTRRWGPELWGWAAAYPLYIFSAVGVTTSFLRYLLLAFPFALTVVPAASTPRQRRIRTAIVCLVCIVGLASQWWWISNLLLVSPREQGYATP